MIALDRRRVSVKNTAPIILVFCVLQLTSLLSAQQTEDNYYDFGSDKGITFTATPENTQQMKVIDKEIIEKRAARDLASLLEEELDMSVTRWGAYGNKASLNLRGFDTERIAILIDGVPANSPRSGDFDVSQVDLNNVERIEVIYGGSDTKYNVSGALGGVINIITAKKQKEGFDFGFTVSTTGYAPGEYNKRYSGGKIGDPELIDLLDMQSLSLFAAYGAEKISAKGSLFGNRAGNHYLFKDDYGFARRKISNDVIDGGGAAQIVFNLPDGAALLSDSKLYASQKDFPITMNSEGKAVANEFQFTENIMLNTPYLFNDKFASEASLSWQHTRSSYGANISSYDHYINVVDRWTWYPLDKITARFGGDWRFLFVDTDSPIETVRVKTGNQGGLYVTGEFKPLKSLMFIASVKGVTDTKQFVASPKAGISWKFNEHLTIKNNYFRSFKFPDFDDLYYRSADNIFSGNPNLRPEDGWGTDIIAEVYLNEYFSAESALFIQWTTDSIHWIKSAGGRWSPENVGTACFVGADVRPVLTIPIEKWGLTYVKIGFSYQFLPSWLFGKKIDFAKSYRIPYLPTHIIGGNIDLGWKTGSVFISAHYEGRRYADTLNQMPLAPYCFVNLTVNQNIGSSLTVFGALRNILNAHYESFASYNMPGFTFVLGLRGKFALPKSGASGSALTRTSDAALQYSIPRRTIFTS